MRFENHGGMRARNGFIRTVAAIVSALTIGGVPAAIARPDAPDTENKPPLQTLFVGERGVCRDLFVSEKDSALLRAVDMLPARLKELRAQVPELQEMPPEAIDLMVGIMSHPMRIAITNKGFDQQTGMPGIGAVISFKMGETGEADAKSMHQQFETLRGMSPMPFEPAPSKRFPGMTDLPLPVGVLSYGPRRAADGWRYDMIFAAIDDPDAVFNTLPAVPAGVAPVVRGSIDLAAWSPLVSMFAGFAAMASPQGQQVIDQFREAGLIGPDAMKFEWSLGHSAQRMEGTLAVRRMGKHAGAMSRATITDDDLAAIPSDASYIDIAKFDLKKSWESMRNQFERAGGGEIKSVLDEVREALGFDPETEVIAAMGETVALYFSDTTGGGSMMSGVLMLALADPARMLAAMDKAAAKANHALAQEVQAPAAVEVARFERDGVNFTQLRFPGLPVPIQPTIAVAGKWMVVGVTPQAATAAARHILAAKPGGGVLSNPAFTAARWNPPGGAGASVIHFADPSRTMRDGYASLTLLASAIENAARTMTGAPSPRDPGMVLPVYSDLLRDTRPMMMISYWSEDDFITDLRGDRSVLASLATLLGIGDVMPFIGGAVVGGAIGANAGEEARQHHRSFEDFGDESGEDPSDEEPEPEPAHRSDERHQEKTPY
ncbi:MAG: hypothetical protein JNK58_05625 [Phycisphaerae bacterium]|nr:hypothetical protein [Phycisphaerae bacterium]